MVSLSDYQRQQQSIIDKKLEATFASYRDLLPALHEAMHYAVFSGGKRIRPLLVIAATQAVGGASDNALDAAAAVELFHTYTLIHDDLPAMDNDELRRGQPTVHIKFGEANAILTGDALQAAAFAALAPHPKASQLITELADTGLGVVAGQWRDMAVNQSDATKDDIHFIHEHKTADLLRTSVRLGAMCGDATDEQLADLTAYGTAIGHLFQLTDDLLDADEERPNAVSVLGKEKTEKLADQYHQDAKKRLRTILSPDILAAIADFIYKRSV